MILDWELLGEDWRGLAPKVGGVYLFIEKRQPVYIGKSKQIRTRIAAHCATRTELAEGKWEVRFHPCDKDEADRIERASIAHYQPRLNVKLRTGKTRRIRKRTDSNLSRALHAWRKMRGLTVGDAAALIGISRDALYSLEKGESVHGDSFAALIRWMFSPRKDSLSKEEAA